MTDTRHPLHQPADQGGSPLSRLRLLFDRFGASQAKFASRLGIDPSAMSKILTGKMPITDQFCNRVAVNLGVSKAWFKYGEGVPYPRTADVEALDAEGEQPRRDHKGAPVYDIDVTAGPTPLDTMFTEDNIAGYVNLPGLNADNPIVHVKGDSMAPRIPHDSYVSLSAVTDPSLIVWGAPYVVQLENYRLLKVLKPCPDKPGYVRLHSYNADYDDIEVERSAILKLFRVENVLTWQSLGI
ncbi:MAG: XRE family transcriptional regulator [Muribaculaceae bacterium]|nr:XRE family transcriptional regulator [Muribaculaceae bacterium]